MHISKVKTAFKIADVELVPHNRRLNFNYLKELKDENHNPLPQSLLTKNVARVYLIVVDGVIKKIGGSQDKGGIKRTLHIYRDGGVKGRPSIRSFGIWYFLYHTILSGKKIEFYMIYQDNFKADVKGLFSLHGVPEASINYKFLENACLLDHHKMMGDYPEWNVQEQGKDWPSEIKDAHARLLQNAQTRKKKVKRGAVQISKNTERGD
ncbi:Type II restriction endonuclease [Helicobacter sp. NHP19-003]|uniref:Type II restriction endonuclease n=1 Tax=Helicobacter gastrocanis TaxID=2849641 RepID=A0ABN6I6C1_9HELI|nr:GIY-YIG nuclease family protein [Helicobacter sp. NHP19-003]BCZ18139.1 Type II restriction endonuclease [Helicobacter sp. NHP19-003]